MEKLATVRGTLRLGEIVEAESPEGLLFTGKVVALTPATVRIQLPDGRLAFLPSNSKAEDGPVAVRL